MGDRPRSEIRHRRPVTRQSPLATRAPRACEINASIGLRSVYYAVSLRLDALPHYNDSRLLNVASRLRSEACEVPNAGQAEAAGSCARHYHSRLRLARVDAFLCGWRSKARCLPRNGNATVFAAAGKGATRTRPPGSLDKKVAR